MQLTNISSDMIIITELSKVYQFYNLKHKQLLFKILNSLQMTIIM